MESYNIINDEKWKLNNQVELLDKIIDKEFSQPKVMIEKIKKIKNKKNKKMNNYKNIELFENIHDAVYDENIDTNYTNKPIIEGLTNDPIAHFRDSDYDGINDNIFEGGNKSSNNASNKGIIDFINEIFDKFHKFTYYIAFNITKTFSSKKDYNHNDVYVVQKYVGWFFSILLSCYIVYNWAFIMFYKDEIGKSVELPVFLDREHFDTMSYINVIYRLVDYFIHFSLFFPEMLQKGLNLISEYVPKILNTAVCFSLLFFFIVFFSYHSIDYIKNFFLSIVTLNYKNPILMAMYFTIIFLLLLYLFEYDVNPINVISKINPLFFMVSSVFSILRYIFIIFFGVPIAAILCIIYIFIYSFFGIILLNGFNFKEFWKTFSKINDYCKKAKPKVRKETTCEPFTLFEKIVNNINYGFDFIYSYAFQLSFMYLFLYGIIEYLFMNNLKSNTLKMTLSVVNLVLLFTIGMNCYNDFVSKDDSESEIETDVESKVKKNKDVIESDVKNENNLLKIPTSLGDISKIADLPGVPKIPTSLGDISKIADLPGVPKIPTSLGDISKIADLPSVPEIPKKLSEVSKMAKMPDVPEIPTNLADISKLANLSNVPKIPKNLSEVSKIL
jgi:hypothetical protein